MSRRLTAVLSTATALTLTVLSGGRPAAAAPAVGNCGFAIIQAGSFGGGNLDILLQVDTDAPFTTILKGTAAGWWINRSQGTFGGLSAQSPNYRSSIDGSTWNGIWDDTPTGTGYVRIDFPIIDVFTTAGHCYGLFPSETVLVPEDEGDQVLLRREVKLTSKSASDVTVVADVTSSMEGGLRDVRARAREIADALLATSEDTRVRVVSFNDASARVVQEFTDDPAALAAAFGKLRGVGGGDIPEAVHSGLQKAVQGSWRRDATRNVLLLGDAPGKDPEPRTRLTFAQVTRNLSTVTFTDGEGAAVDVSYQGYLPVDVVNVNGSNAAYFQSLATATGGTYRSSTPKQTAAGVQTVVAAIDGETGTA